MGNFRFIHAADIHLDSPLTGLAGVEGPAAERIRTAPRAAFERLVERAIQEDVDFLVIAGDLYDGTWKAYSTGLFFAAQMGRLNQAEIPVFVLHGNHDAESELTSPLVLPGNVRVFKSCKPETFSIDHLDVALHGQSFPEKAVSENLVPNYPAPVAGAFNIGVLHTSLGGMGPHANYAPCNLEELVAKGYDYWALGHVHQRQVLHVRPHVVFPGNLQGRHVRETGPKGAVLVTVEGKELVELAELDLDVVRWAVLPVDVATAETFADVVELILGSLTAAAGDADGRLLACRAELGGRSALHHQLVVGVEELMAQARSAALGLGEEAAWVERVTVATAPETDPKTLAAREDLLGELQRMLEDAPGDPDLLARLGGDLGELTRSLPHELRETVDDPALAAAVEGELRTLIEEVKPYLNARLMAEED